MKKTLSSTLVIATFLLLMSSAAIAAECSGSWKVLPNYIPGSGGACAVVGLDTHQATCQYGQNYATYCDDSSGGRFRICKSNLPCPQLPRCGEGYNGYRDYPDYSRYEERGFRNNHRNDRYDRRDNYRNYRHEHERSRLKKGH